MRRPARRVVLIFLTLLFIQAPGRVDDSDEDEPIFETANLNRGVVRILNLIL